MSQRMWLGGSDEILAYQMRTLSDMGARYDEGWDTDGKENKDMGDGGRDRRMQSTALRATSPEPHRRPAGSAIAVGRGVARSQERATIRLRLRLRRHISRRPILTRSRLPCAGIVDDQNSCSCSDISPLFSLSPPGSNRGVPSHV